MNFPKISIITPSFNQGNYLEDTILSVINQKYPNLEYIIIDGGSTDNSIDIIRKYEEKIDYWVSEKDDGQSDAINKGLKRATGDIVAWLNSDDLYLDDTLNAISKIFSENPHVDLIYGDVLNFNENTGEESVWVVHEFEPLDFLKRTYIHQPAVFWRNAVHNDVGYLDTSLYYQMDYDFWMRIFFKKETLKINKSLAKFRIHDSSKTSSNPPGMYLEYRKVFSRFINSLENKSYKQKLLKLGIYSNIEDVKFDVNIKPYESILDQVLENYIYNCAVQEYTFGSAKQSIKLFSRLLNGSHKLKSISFILKITFGLRRLRHNSKSSSL